MRSGKSIMLRPVSITRMQGLMLKHVAQPDFFGDQFRSDMTYKRWGTQWKTRVISILEAIGPVSLYNCQCRIEKKNVRKQRDYNSDNPYRLGGYRWRNWMGRLAKGTVVQEKARRERRRPSAPGRKVGWQRSILNPQLSWGVIKLHFKV